MIKNVTQLIEQATIEEVRGYPKKYKLVKFSDGLELREIGKHSIWDKPTTFDLSEELGHDISEKWTYKEGEFTWQSKFVGIRTLKQIVALLDKDAANEIAAKAKQAELDRAEQKRIYDIENAKREAREFIKRHGDSYGDMTLNQIIALEA